MNELKGLRIRNIIDAIADRRLYGVNFFLQAGPLLAVGFLVGFSVLFTLNHVALTVYVCVFFLFVLISGLGSKNYGREIPGMGYFRGLLFLIVSVLASPMPFLTLENSLYGLIRFCLLLTITYCSLWVAVTEVTISGQRVSLRESIPLKKEFFAKQKGIWKEKLAGFHNLEEIVSDLDDGKFVTSFFDRGSFDLAVLWSCNIMEEIIDKVIEDIVSSFPEKKALFRKDNGKNLRYPEQLRNLGFEPQEKRNAGGLSLDKLWHEVRNNIAHHKYKPSFHETYGALTMLVLFIEEMPRILEAWE